MDVALIPPSPTPVAVPAVPGWALPRRPVSDPAEAAFLAGAALSSLDSLAPAARLERRRRRCRAVRAGRG